MHFTFFMLFRNMQRVGSKVLLGMTVMVYGALSFFISLVVMQLSGMSINPLLIRCVRQ